MLAVTLSKMAIGENWAAAYLLDPPRSVSVLSQSVLSPHTLFIAAKIIFSLFSLLNALQFLPLKPGDSLSLFPYSFQRKKEQKLTRVGLRENCFVSSWPIIWKVHEQNRGGGRVT